MILQDLNISAAWESAVPFQKEDADFAARNSSVVLGHQTGLGKTFISLLAWSKWPKANKALICGTLGSMATWYKVMTRWGGVEPKFIQGKSDPLWAEALAVKEGVYMCTYMTFLYGMKTVLRGKPYFDLLVNDELHRMMRTRNKIWEQFKRLEFEHYLGLSATWASRGPQDCFPVLNLVNRQTFSSYWRFVNTWCYVEKSTYGTEIFGVRNAENLRAMLHERYYRARTWPEVGAQFRKGEFASSNPVIRRVEEILMGKQQTKLIRELDAEMIVELGPDRVVTPNSLALLTRKLQMAISPKILMPSAEYGGVIDWMVNTISDDRHTVIFCPFREGLDVLRQALIDDKYPEDRIFVFRGGMRPDEINERVRAWKQSQGVALCTIAFAQSFDLDTTDTAYMLGFDWDPNNNYQAEGRLRRFDTILQTPCMVRYIVPEGSDYHQVMEVVDGKVINVREFLAGYGKVHAHQIPMVNYL
jgi:hypothetical protein